MEEEQHRHRRTGHSPHQPLLVHVLVEDTSMYGFVVLNLPSTVVPSRLGQSRQRQVINQVSPGVVKLGWDMEMRDKKVK